jgi:primosomal protein N' (replication factor Y)
MSSLFAGDPTVGFARVAVERGVDQYPDGLTYAVPKSLAPISPGERVVVPLGRGDKPTGGYVIELADASDLDPSKIKPIARRDALGASLPPQLLELARWISSYYVCPIGMTLSSMMPAAVKKHVGLVTKRLIELSSQAEKKGSDPFFAMKLPPKQKAVLQLVAGKVSSDGPIELRELMQLAGLKTPGAIQRLVQRGLLRETRRSAIEAVWAAQAIDRRAPGELTGEQKKVIAEISEALIRGRGFSTHLLYGVTGSGKTEVYIRLIEQVIAAGKIALVLVPEISLTPQTGGRLIGRFPNHRVAVLHSGLTAAQRNQQWSLVADDEADIVLGARSAVFAPILDGRLGLIIVDEEHDGSYKQDQSPRYHGRDVAIRRAQLAGCPIVLGSATPSLESWHNATARKNSTLHRMANRVPGMKLPRVVIVDFIEQRKARPREDRHIHLIGPVMEHEIGRTLESGDGQIILLLNRRGYANYIACPDHRCGWVMTCTQCDVTVVYHLSRNLPAGGFVRCHHCLTEQKLPANCPVCGNKVVPFGLGTQRVEEELHRKFPALVAGETMLRVDSDSMHGSRDFHDALGRFGEGKLRLLVGTQMIAKGLDFPGVRLVGVINADTAINLPDFRATERTFQLVNQVAGRCGRGVDPGLVIVQSFAPKTAAIQLAAAHDYEGFAAGELEERREVGLPPWGRMVRLVARDEDQAACVAAARALAERLRELASPEVRLRGPAPCPIARIAGKHRWQIELLAPAAGSLQHLLAAARNDGSLRPGEDLAVDVDPIALL